MADLTPSADAGMVFLLRHLSERMSRVTTGVWSTCAVNFGARQGRSDLARDRTPFFVVLVQFEFLEDRHEFADASARQRSAGIHQRFVIVDPGLSFGQFLGGRTGRNDLRDG